VAALNRSIPIVVSTVQPNRNEPEQENIHTVAEKFLRDHLAKTGSKCEAVRPIVTRTACAVESKKAAEGFLREHLTTRQTEAKRYQIVAPERVILARRTGNVTCFFYGWKVQRPLFTHAEHLAQVIDIVKSDELVQMLRQCNIEVTVLPAPEMGRGSF
jgi:hypothetical protein